MLSVRQLCHSHGGALSAIVSSISTWPNQNQILNGYHATYRTRDQILQAHNLGVHFPRFRTLGEITNMKDDSYVNITHWEGLQPRNTVYDGRADYLRFRSIFGGIYPRTPSSAALLRNEKDVIHVQPLGDVTYRPGLYDAWYNSAPTGVITNASMSWPIWTGDLQVMRHRYTNTANSISFGTGSTSPRYRTYEQLLDHIKTTIGQGSHTHNEAIGGGIWIRTITSNVAFEASSSYGDGTSFTDTIVVTWDFSYIVWEVNKLQNTSYWHRFTQKRKLVTSSWFRDDFTLDYALRTNQATYSGPIMSSTFSVLSSTYTKGASAGSNPYPNYVTSTPKISTVYSGNICGRTTSPLVPHALVDVVKPLYSSFDIRRSKKRTPNDILRRFRAIIDEDLDNLLPATFYSTQAAINGYTDVLTTNHVESLSELAGIGNLLPTIKPLVDIIRDVKARNYLDAGGHILDALSGYHLQKKFGIDPTVSAVREFADKYDSVSARLRLENAFGWKTLYGRFSYELPQGIYGTGRNFLVVQSKVLVEFQSTTALTASLGARALGLKPGFSSFWDLLPFSFVLDWFTNLGDKLEAVDDRAFMLLLPCGYSLHSISVENYLDNEEFLLSQESGREPKLRYYRRFLSAYLPPLRKSIYDFTSPPSNPTDLLTVGSLAWTVLS